MTTAYNIRNQLDRSSLAGRQELRDPGAGGVIALYPNEDATCIITTTSGTRTMQDPTQLNVGMNVLIMASNTGTGAVLAATGISSITLTAGQFVELTVVLNSSGVKVWAITG